jgi:hypothetical protein
MTRSQAKQTPVPAPAPAASTTINVADVITVPATATTPTSAETTTTTSTGTFTGGDATRGKKRKAETTTPEEDEQEDIARYKKDLDILIPTETFLFEPPPGYDPVRQRINNLLDSGIVTKAEFAGMLGCGKGGTRSLNRFLRDPGESPTTTRGGNVYYSAYTWFRQREVAELKVPEKLKLAAHYTPASIAASKNSATSKKINGTTATNTSAARNNKSVKVSKSNSSSSPSASMSAREAALHRAITAASIDEIYLEGEETDEVPIYDSCDEVRRKIEEHLRTSPKLSATQFCRDLAAQLFAPENEGRNISWGQLASFRKLKGPRAGAKSIVFYAAYVYFEKLRVANGEPKSEHRETMEGLWEHEGGFSRDIDHNTTLVGPFSFSFSFSFLLSFFRIPFFLQTLCSAFSRDGGSNPKYSSS